MELFVAGQTCFGVAVKLVNIYQLSICAQWVGLCLSPTPLKAALMLCADFSNPRRLNKLLKRFALDPSKWRTMSEVLVGFIVTAAYLQHLRESREQEQQKRWIAEQGAHARAEERKAPAAQQTTLRLHAQSWARATELRAYISAVRAAIGNGSIIAPPEGAEAWLAWADTHADELDPICAGRTLSLIRLNIDEDECPLEKPLYGRHL
jgi:hypothetical protein